MNKSAIKPPKSLKERVEEIELLMKYAVPEEHFAQAKDFLANFATDGLVLHIFHNFYSFLPEGQDDAITAIKNVLKKDGLCMLCVRTLISDYIYLVNYEKAEFLGPLPKGIWDEEVLQFFGLNSETFTKQFKDADKLEDYTPLTSNADICKICFVASGEVHQFGCPAEICPWCGGQLTGCNCRFIQLGTSTITNQTQLQTFLELLENKGRIPFTVEDQNIGFPALK